MTKSKYQVGQRVHCFRKETVHFIGFDFVGVIEHVSIVADDEIEYRISNAPLAIGNFPCLIWEEGILSLKGDSNEPNHIR